MRSLALWIVALVGALAHGQGFNRRHDAFGLGRAQGAWDIELTNDGYMVLSVSSDADSISPDSSFYHYSVLFTKLDGDGNMLNEARVFRPWHGTTSGWANCSDTLPGGGFVVGGATESLNSIIETYLFVTDAQGDTLWTRVFGGPNQSWIGRQVKRTPNGGFLIVGDTDANGSVDGFALKTDSLGNEEWRQTYSGGGLSDYVVSVDRADGGDYLLGGQKRISADDKDLWLLRIDSVGAVRWSRSWGSAFDEPNAHLSTLADGHALVASAWGYDDDFNATRAYLSKLDSTDGSTIWDREYGPVAYGAFLFAAKERFNGELIACGVTWANLAQQGLLLRTTSQGDSIWMRTYFYQDTLITTGQGRFYDVLPTDDGGFIAAGSAYNPAGAPYPPGYSQDTWVVKVDSMGCIIPGCDGVGVEEMVTNLGNSLTVYPNPAHGSTTVQVQLPQSRQGGTLRLAIVDAHGRVVHEQIAQQGANPLDLSGLAAGLYYLHLANGTTWLAGSKLVVE